MKFWQSITRAETDQLCDIARFADDLGFEAIIGAGDAPEDGPSTLDQKKRLMERFAEDILRHF